jgi:HSP20 family molecular chaperone IbpA
MRVVKKSGKNRDIIDEVFDNVFKTPLFALSDRVVKMQTDLREVDEKYILDIDLAGFDKSNISITIEEEHLKVEAVIDENKISKEEYIRRERHFESCSRSYYVGDLKQENVTANFNNGILTISFPVPKEEVENKKYVDIS